MQGNKERQLSPTFDAPQYAEQFASLGVVQGMGDQGALSSLEQRGIQLDDADQRGESMQ
ncbi:hypothetical protein LVV80_01340 [Pseudomonas sp. KCA11]|jgi:hypothetical protein|uniref:hypothetical protein n=1 Tax=Pseudomonas sp. TaxID=306 RepID=UPI001F2AF741|nr:hypothetical protein [Pseudomonas sp. KCA11]MCE5990666.1 hypothetical protein [Pseudomonas sp. KCA11]